MIQNSILSQDSFGFIGSIDLTKHPLLSAKRKIIIEYVYSLFYFLSLNELDDYSRLRLMKYAETFDVPYDSSESIQKNCANKVFFTKVFPWKTKYKYWLLCDLAMILMDKNRVSNIA